MKCINVWASATFIKLPVLWNLLLTFIYLIQLTCCDFLLCGASTKVFSYYDVFLKILCMEYRLYYRNQRKQKTVSSASSFPSRKNFNFLWYKRAFDACYKPHFLVVPIWLAINHKSQALLPYLHIFKCTVNLSFLFNTLYFNKRGVKSNFHHAELLLTIF